MPLLAVLTPLALQVAAAVTGFGGVAPVRRSAPAADAPVAPPAPAPVSVPAPPPQTFTPAPLPLAPAPMQTPPPAPPVARALRPIGLVTIREPAVAITF